MLVRSRLLLVLLITLQTAITCTAKKTTTKEIECSAVRHVNSSSQCSFVESTDDCHFSNGFIQYNYFIYCKLDSLHSVAFVILGIWLIYLFVFLGVSAEEFFCPCLKTFAKTLRMSDSVAGVTLLALGNGASDIFSVLASFTTGDKDSAPLAFQELFGSGMFITTIVAGSIQLRNSFKLARRPFIRDLIFSIIAVGWTFAVMYRKDIQTAEAIGFIVMYVVYVALVIIGQAVNRNIKSRSSLSSSDLTHAVNDGEIQHHGKRMKREILQDLDASADFTEFDANDRRILINKQKPVENISSINNEEQTEDSVISDDEFVCDERFVERITGLYFKEWKLKGWFWKIFDCMKIPIQMILNLSNPVIDVDEKGMKWNKWLAVLQSFISPVICSFIIKKAFTVVFNKIVVWEIMLVVGALLALAVVMMTSETKPPKFFPIFAVAGFVVSVIWIYACAAEIVNLLIAFGVAFGLSNALLGLTLLAWGNSIGDLVANTAMARNGAPRMAMAACYGGPLLNIMLGVGISCTLSALTYDGDVKLIRGNVQYIVSAAFFGTSLITAMILMPILKFNTSKYIGIYLIFLYLVYLTVSVLTEVKIIGGQ